jgi:hypothetical protein
MKGEAVALDDLLPVGAGSKGDALHLAAPLRLQPD